VIKIRCSSLHQLMSKPQSGSGLSETAKSMIKKTVIQQHYGRVKEVETPEIRKGKLLEDEAIKAIGLIKARSLKKHTGRVFNDWITGECDFINDSCIEDVKCSWSIDTFPFFQEDAAKQCKKSGYDWQGQGYMWLYNRPAHYVHYVLLPTPFDLLKPYDNHEMHIDLVESIPLRKRIKTVVIERNESLHQQVIEKAEMAQEYAKKLILEL